MHTSRLVFGFGEGQDAHQEQQVWAASLDGGSAGGLSMESMAR